MDMKKENAILVAPQRGLAEKRKDEKTVVIMTISFFEERISSGNRAYGAGEVKPNSAK